MKKTLFLIILICTIGLYSENLIFSDGKNVKDRILLPEGFVREDVETGSFGEFLRNIPLKPDGSDIHYYNGKIKAKNVHVAVLDIDVGDKNLQQCADAIIRLRAEYLYYYKKYDEISFHLTNGFKCNFSKWIEGYRLNVLGNNVSWEKKADINDDYEVFRNYLEQVFIYAGSYSLEKEMKAVNYKELEIGNIFIQGGFPGHAVIVLDTAINPETNEKIYLLAQSYMPAQEIHILKNISDKNINPWYKLDINKRVIVTPEWIFSSENLKKFK